MVIEELQFEVDPADRVQWLEVEEAVWTRFLEAQDGFIRKERWLHDANPRIVSVMIWWATTAQWKRITVEQVDAVDAEMGEWLRPVVAERVYEVLDSPA
jgi:uncharacterized protein (TIGR03792 family)